MLRLNLSPDGVRNCKETTTLVEKCEKIIECKKKKILNLTYKKFEKSKETDKFKEMFQKMEQVEIVKVLEWYPKLEEVMSFK